MDGEDLVTSGGRVMAFTSYGETKEKALEKSYASIGKVCYEGIYFRKDIGFDL
jgi:phosphoribosylamine--glycine ligase